MNVVGYPETGHAYTLELPEQHHATPEGFARRFPATSATMFLVGSEEQAKALENALGLLAILLEHQVTDPTLLRLILRSAGQAPLERPSSPRASPPPTEGGDRRDE